MAKILPLLVVCCLMLGHVLQADVRQGGINWLTNYNEAVQKAQRESKPIVLFFTGSDWCSWCTKLEREALHTREFNDKAGSQFVFVLLDFPSRKTQDPNLAQQNRNLQEKYKIKGYPALVIIDSNQRYIGQTGYQAGGGSAYADHLLKLANKSAGLAPSYR